MGVCMSVTPDEAKRQAEEKAKADAAAATLLMGVPSLAPGDDGTVLKPETSEDKDLTTLTKEKEEKPKSTGEIGDLDSEKGHDFWSLFWAVIFVLANPKTTWELLPDRVKKPLTTVAKAAYNAADKLVITPTQFLVNNAVVKPVDFVVNKLVVAPVAYAAEKLVAAPINFVANTLANAAGKVADKVEENVVNPITEKIDAVTERVTDKVDAAIEGAGAALDNAASNVKHLFSKQSAQSPPKPSDNTYLPEYNMNAEQRGSVSGAAASPEIKPDKPDEHAGPSI